MVKGLTTISVLRESLVDVIVALNKRIETVVRASLAWVNIQFHNYTEVHGWI